MRSDAEFTVVGTGTPAEWERWTRENVAVGDDGVRLAREATPGYTWPERVDVGGTHDVDVDGCGVHYVLGERGELSRADSADGPFEAVECLTLGEPDHPPTALAVTGDTLYVVGTHADDTDGGERGYVRALSPRDYQTRWVLDGTGGRQFRRPTRVVRSRSGHGVYVLDASGFVARVCGDGSARVVVDGLVAPRDLTVDDAGGVAVLHGDGARPDIELFPRVDRPDECPPDIDAGEDEEAPEMSADGGADSGGPIDGATSIEAVDTGVFVVGVGAASAEEKTLYRYSTATGAVEPLTGFRGVCRRLRRGPGQDGPGALYVVGSPSAGPPEATPADGGTGGSGDSGGAGVVWVLGSEYAVEAWNGADDDPDGPYVGRLCRRFDLGDVEPSFVRLHVAAGEVPPGTRVDVRYAVTDGGEPPAGYCEDDSTPEATTPYCGCEGDDSDGGAGENGNVDWTVVEVSSRPDVLVRSEGGRTLWVMLTLVGSQYDSPRVRSFKLSFTHESYVHYLPAIYQEDARSADFLERFLSVFEDAFGDVDHGIATLTRYFDPATIPAPHLSWLGGWLAVAEDDEWSEQSKRGLVEAAPRLFKQRGTKRGLSAVLDLFLEGVERPRGQWSVAPDEEGDPVDAYRLATIVEYADVASIAATDGGVAESERCRSPCRSLLDCPQEFAVLLHPSLDDATRATVERIVEAERPVHTVGRVVPLQSWGRLGEYTYLGVNTTLQSRAFVLGEARLGWSSELSARGAEHTLGWESRVGAARLS